MGLVKETLSSCRAILSGQEEVVHNGECVQLTMADAMEAMMAQSQLTIAAFGTGTGALKEVCAFAGHRLDEQPLLLWHQEQGTVRGLQRSEQGLGAFIQGMTVFSARCLVGHQLEVIPTVRPTTMNSWRCHSGRGHLFTVFYPAVGIIGDA